MLEISRETVRGVPVLTLIGRLDSSGASLLDQEDGPLVDANPYIVLEFSQVEYLSSLGIRSLLTLEKALKSGSGGLILTGLNPFVSQALELSGLLNRFLFKESVKQSVDMALELGAHEDLGEMRFGGRAYRVHPADGHGFGDGPVGCAR